MKKFLLFVLVAFAFAACEQAPIEEQTSIRQDAPETITVGFEGDDETRIQLNEAQKTVWTKGDLVSVFYRSNANQKWQYQGETGERTGDLKRVNAGNATETTSKVVVVYPYNEKYYINPETCDVEAFLPSQQTFLKDSYGLDGNIMISSGYYNQFSLKNVCGWLKIQLTGNGEKVQSITLRGNNGEQVAGEIYINSATAEATLASEMGGADDTENGAGGNLVFDNTILNEVVLDCGEGVALSSTVKSFYIALPPQTYEKGLTIDIACTNGSTMKKSTSNAIAIERNAIQPMASITYDGVVPEVFELAYTTNDGEPLDPYTTEGFGANFVENIFDATTGKGFLKFDGKITTIPAKAFIVCTNLTEINLPIGVTAINSEAFNGCRKLAVMDIPQGVKTIGNKAFYNCEGITEITIPSSVTSIGTSSFEGCGGKANINCKIASVSSESSGKFYKAKFTEIFIGNSISSIGGYAFYGCTELTSITIPDSVTSIGDDAFNRCTSLTSITIPDRVTSIGNYAFYYCTSLKEVYYTGDLSAWCKINFGGLYANPMCNGVKLYLNGVELTEATIPSDITEIKKCTFYGCTSLKSVILHNRVTSIGERAFNNCTSLTSITIPDSVTSIGEYAFYNCRSLTSITIPDSVTEIGDYTFNGCTSLTSITIPDSVTEIGDYTFNGCTSLTSITIPDRVTSIGGSAFYRCTSLTSVTIGNSVTSIAKSAFEGCTSLTSVTIPDSVTRIGDYAFEECTLLTSVTIGNSVTSFGASAFDHCTSLISVTIGNGVTEIGQAAFWFCTSLTSVTIPDSVTLIRDWAFYGCSSLKEVYCKPTTPPSGGSNMFSKWENGETPIGCTIYVPRESVEAYKAAEYWSVYASYIVGYDFL